MVRRNESLCESSGQPQPRRASLRCLPLFKHRARSLRWVAGTLRLLKHLFHGLQHLDLTVPVSLLVDLLRFSPHLPSSAARLNYIIYKTVEDLWTPLMLGAVWLVGTASSPMETYTHQRLSMQKIEEMQRGGQRRFCAMKMVHKGPLRREINVSWLKRACCDGLENVSGTGAQMWGGWMNVSGIPRDLQPESKLCQKCTCKYASLKRVCV